MKFLRARASGTALAVLLAGAALAAPRSLSPVAHPALWPAVKAQPARDPRIEARIDKLVAAMSIEDKVGQLLQVDILSITPADAVKYKVGAILDGGNSGPYDDELAPPAKWLKLADAFYDANMTRTDGRPRIPLIWGTDAVHGNNNLVGAVLFPHNIGLGAARDPALIRRIGEVTAAETAAAGLDWTFAPTLAVVQDDRWGRTYESYAEEPQVQASYAGAMVEGLQGRVGDKDFLGPDHVIATTKHFLGDGGTGGRDQGDTRVPEAVLRDVHLGGYPAAIAAGTQSVMASFSSWNGAKMSGNASLLTGVLKHRMGFDGFVVGDWNSHGQLPGCTSESCAAAIDAGLDMFMYSGPDFKALYANTLAQARSGEIPAARLDDAVRRILRVKLRAGLFERKRPSSHPLAGRFDLVGSPAHRAVGRQAVRESLVLLKNEGGLLPLTPRANILVAGHAADSISQQAGGWSITWQGAGLPNADFPHAQSIWSGIAEAVGAAGGKATLSPDGSFAARPDAAIVVFGEQPYAEFRGDRANLEYSPDDKSDLALLRKLKAAGVPVVAVFLSGRPLWVNAELNASDAFVAAFLPGSEGGGVADLLFRRPAGGVAFDFRGKLSFSWPKRPDQYALNRRDPGYDPLFPFGFGLTYASRQHLPMLDERRPAGMVDNTPTRFLDKGAVPAGWRLAVADAGGPPMGIGNSATATPLKRLAVTAIDRLAQEDSYRMVWNGAGAAGVRIVPDKPLDLARETNGDISLIVDYRVDKPPTAPVSVVVTAGTDVAVPIAGTVANARVGEWQQLVIPLQCFRRAGADMLHVTVPFALETAGALDLFRQSLQLREESISSVRLDYVSMPLARCGDHAPPR